MDTATNGHNITFLLHTTCSKEGEHLGHLLTKYFMNANIIYGTCLTDSLRLVQQHNPDIFILEMVNYPATSHLIQFLTTLEYKAIVIVVASNSISAIGRCLTLGAKGYIIKPIDDALFLKTMEDIVNKYVS